MEIDGGKTTEDLPEEILEYIISLVSPYKDFDACKLACRRWHRLCQRVCQHSQNNLYRAIISSTIVWKTINDQESPPSITKRYSHSACYIGGKLYVFGGCTSTCTTFNDLWTLDMTTRLWHRPVTTGTYPSPKASATLIYCNNSLILFGGWTHPSPYPLHQALRLFNEVHQYDIVSNRWSSLHFSVNPPPIAGHSATVHGNIMVIFGGLKKTLTLRDFGCSNDVWCLDLVTLNWTKQSTTDPKPSPRYGQSQIVLDEYNILILGGCGGLNFVHEDIWLLTLTHNIWVWTQIAVMNLHWAAPHIWCHAACKINDRVVVFSKRPSSPVVEPIYTGCCTMRRSAMTVREDNSGIPPDVIARQASNTGPAVAKDKNCNIEHGYLSNKHNQPSTSRSTDGPSDPNDGAGPSTGVVNKRIRTNINATSGSPSMDESMLAFRDKPIIQTVSKNRLKQLELLNKMEERYKQKWEEEKRVKNKKPPNPSPNSSSTNDGTSMCMYVLDISHVLDEHVVIWKQPDVNRRAPRDNILHTVSLGRGEIVLFGGILKDPSLSYDSPASLTSVSNKVYFVTAPKNII